MFRGNVDFGRMRFQDALEGGWGAGDGVWFHMERYAGFRLHLRGYEGMAGRSEAARRMSDRVQMLVICECNPVPPTALAIS